MMVAQAMPMLVPGVRVVVVAQSSLLDGMLAEVVAVLGDGDLLVRVDGDPRPLRFGRGSVVIPIAPAAGPR